jgi:hypothetical protein
VLVGGWCERIGVITIGVHDGDDVEVVLVQEGLDLLVAALVAQDELTSDVLNDLEICISIVTLLARH